VIVGIRYGPGAAPVAYPHGLSRDRRGARRLGPHAEALSTLLRLLEHSEPMELTKGQPHPVTARPTSIRSFPLARS
jgi:hypothetical protein